MEYGTVLLLTFVISVAVIGLILAFLIAKGGKKGNIEYLIIQTYLGNKRPIKRRGMVKIDTAEHIALFTMFDKGQIHEIGTFPQKYLLPWSKGFLMLLDQYEIGRYRPLEISDEVKPETYDVTQKDFLGMPERDKDGKFIKTNEKITKRVIKTVSNEDFDFIIGSREKLKSKLLKRAKKKSFWRTIAAIALYFFLFLSIAFNAYYNFETHQSNQAMIERQSEAKVAEQVTKTIMYVLMNQTIKDVVKPVPLPTPS